MLVTLPSLSFLPLFLVNDPFRHLRSTCVSTSAFSFGGHSLRPHFGEDTVPCPPIFLLISISVWVCPHPTTVPHPHHAPLLTSMAATFLLAVAIHGWGTSVCVCVCPQPTTVPHPHHAPLLTSMAPRFLVVVAIHGCPNCHQTPTQVGPT